MTITDLPQDVWVTTARQVGDRVEVEFGPEKHRAVFDVGWLRQFAIENNDVGAAGERFADGNAEASAFGAEDERTEDAKRLWSGDDIATAFPRGSWPLFQAEAAHKQACLSAVLREGFVVLGDVPREPGAVLTVAESVGFVRQTAVGPVVDVQIGALPPVQAFTSGPLSPRTHLSFRDPLPTLEFVHCLEDAAEGGESILVDGFHAAAALRDKDRAAFTVLANSEVTFAYADAKSEFRATKPVIGVDPRGRIREIRLDTNYMQPLRMPRSEIVGFYAAYRAFSEVLGWPGQPLTFMLHPGDCLIFDNTRILNGRTGFLGTDRRRMQVCWTDLDGLSSTLAVMRRPRTNGRVHHLSS